jgi:hypothetical protein
MAGDIKKEKSFKPHKISLPKEGSLKAEKWFNRREEELRKKQIKRELLNQGIDINKKPPFVIKDGIPHKIVDGKLVPLKKVEK